MKIYGGEVTFRKRGKFYIAECPEARTSAKGITKKEAISKLRHVTESQLIELFWLTEGIMGGPPNKLSEAIIEEPNKIKFSVSDI